MKSYKEQLDGLLNLGLKVHPLNDENCWGIYASTQEKAVKRFYMIKRIFPKATPKELDSSLDGNFGVNLYGDLS